MVNVTVIADHFEATIRDHPKMKLKEIQRRVASEIHVNVNLTRCKRAKKRVDERLSGNFKEEFALLWDYADELRAKNPGSTIKMAVQRVTPNSPPHFKRFFVCFDSLKKGWKEGCRPILGLDGCFLKGPFKSELLSAVGRDANNQMYPVAWAIVEVEYTDSWAWFLNLLAADLDLEDGFGFTIISDQQKGLEIAINDVLPRAEHRNCARHVFANWIGRKKLKSYEFDFWEIVKATTEREWEDKFEALTQKDELVAKDLKSKSPKHWTKAIFGCHSKCDMVDNNICETFNSIILEARYKSIIIMLEEIRVKLMTRIVEKRKFCKSWKQNYGSLVKRKFDQNKKDSIEWNMVWNGDNDYEVKKGRKQYIVKLQDRICSCRSWQLTDLPCLHACCAIWHMGGDPDDYLDQCYHKNTYMKAYAYALHPINGAHDWIKYGIESVLPPIERKMPGRPKKIGERLKMNQRKKSPDNLGNNNSNDPNSKSTSTTSVMSNTLSSSAHKEKQKQNTVDEMDQTYYSGLRSKAFNSHQMSINGSSVQRKSPNKKHKFIAYLINTQESTAQKQLKK
ncbi:hypothetical protein V6N13_133205 [Hibiscus sabdariffa]